MTDMEIGMIEGVRIVRPNPLALAAMRSCCHDAQWVWMNQLHPEVVAKRAADPVYAATIKQYLPLGRYIVTGVWQP